MYRAYYDSINCRLKTYEEGKYISEIGEIDGCVYMCGGKTVQDADLNLIRFMESLREPTQLEKDIANAKKLYNQYWPETPL